MADPELGCLAGDREKDPRPPPPVDEITTTTTTDDASSPSLPPPRGLLARLRHLEARMDHHLGIESDAIERKRAEDRQRVVPPREQLSMALLWASGCMNTSCFATGFLGRQFGLDLRQSLLVTILVSLLGGAVVGAAATFGAATGLRQMSVSRFSFGWWPSKLIAVLNCVQQLGWAAVSCITGGLALTAVSDGRVSLALGIVVLAVAAWLIALVGLHAILVYERYAWIVFFVIFVIILGETGRYADGATPATATGADLAGGVLSLIAVVYGSSASWATVASDYYVHYHADVSRVKVFLMTMFGIGVPTAIGMVAGCVVSSALNVRPDWDAAYQKGLGYVIQESLYPRGFAKFLLTLLVLSGINTNVIGIYSASLSFQQISRPFSLVPRLLWMILSLVCILGLALGGREQLNQYLQSFLSLLGYWCTSYIVILLEEHYIFRKGDFGNYDLDGWNTPARLPLGIGASVAFGLGVVAWCMGMSQTWFIGPLARLIGDSGGDVANEFTFVVTALSYLPARYIELKRYER
ncbi:Permease, cytosine/purines, uracil, thiamine, allantoin [Cordyceps fumosorosea ARSEF 2679]|uniref:Permease, cytosine/purines, uracil, thiamine, allantoin n=1 Tax=Cordyceps fumosorosea (strain ARSEF 2679) TaxID=1081104 RepID=A0A167UBJ1_CORFA|nr:Permease, cytosine/purines, uracil, thiamine, allantoin [Cordyceps fumosorosea ARSEF 2679]OAA61419.1 Permease, cytosine/purines, uracil, thiamine, allantoin [Cordyceps fumosorosea ARSEF 2679]